MRPEFPGPWAMAEVYGDDIVIQNQDESKRTRLAGLADLRTSDPLFVVSNWGFVDSV
jgi:hypothetical protein